MVFEGVVQRAVDPHGTCNGIVRDGTGYCAAGGFVHFVDSTHVDGLAAIRLGFLHEIAVAS